MKESIQSIMENWRPVSGYDGHYEVSNLGNVRSVSRTVPFTCRKTRNIIQIRKSGRTLAPLIWGGYRTVCLHKANTEKRFKIGRLVAEAFCKKEIGQDIVNHKNGNKTDDRAENLEWCTQSHNIKHSYDTKLHIPYQNKKVVCIDTGVEYPSASDAAKHYGVERGSISKAATGRSKTAVGLRWKYI